MPLTRQTLVCLNLCFLLLACTPALASQLPSVSHSDSASERPRIGLVLSGGGARGFAHIGVLKVLEENNIPIDFVVGTSMGSIIGGLYAIGLTPEDIESGVTGINWDKVFDDFANREHKRLRRKQVEYDFFGIKRLGVSGNEINIPPGFIEGQQIELALDRLAYPGFDIRDFDRLSIPYRAIATDIETGKPFVISKGNIARAMRASMSIPGALPPISIDGKLLVDGGIANNIPVDVARQLGAEVIIVVDVSAPLASKEALHSGLDITAQLTTIMTRRVADQQLQTLQDTDVLIIPQARELSSSSFNRYPQMIRAGEKAALARLDEIRRYSLSAEDYAAYKSALPKVANRQPVIDFIEIHNNTRLRDGIMKVRISQKTGQPLDVAQLEKDLSNIYGLDYSSSVVYSVEKRDGKTGLLIYVRDRSWAKDYLQFGLSIESNFEIQSITNFYISYTSHINSLAGEIRAVAAAGSEPRIDLEYYQPLTLDLDYYLSARRGYKTTIFPVLNGTKVEGVERIDRNYAVFAAGKTFLQTTDFRIGIQLADGRTTSISGVEPLKPDFKENFLFIRLQHDSLNTLGMPTSGLFANIEYIANRKDLNSDIDLEQVKLLLMGAGSYRRYTVLARLIAESTLNDAGAQTQINNLFLHGGFLELSGTLRNELLGQQFGLAQAIFYRRLGDFTLTPVYGGFSLETGNSWLSASDISTGDLRYAGSLFVGVDTIVGPISLAFGTTNRGESAFYLNLGDTFFTQ